jgi:hypothetical protein
MHSESLALPHKQFITNKLTDLRIPFSEFTFGNLFLWRHEREYLLCEEEGIHFIRGHSRDQKIILIPLDSVALHLEGYKTLLDKYPPYHLFPLPKVWCELFPDNRYQKESYSGWDDYIYQTKKIALYKGRALDGRRNQVKHFIEEYPFEVVSIDESAIPDALKVLSIWKEKHKKGNDDAFIAKSALENFEELGLEGILIKSRGEPISFAIGEMLLKEMFDVQFAKSNLDYRGVSSLLFQQLAIHLENKYTWLNFEVDLGLEGLRKNKIEYAPDRMEIKWRIQAR